MIVAPFSLFKKIFERRPTTYSPGIKHPTWSKKKHRSKSPSKATPKSAFSSITAFAVDDLFSSSSGLGIPLGKVGSGL